MAGRTRVLQIAIAVVNLSIVALAFTSIWPFPHGDFKVDLPSASEIRWAYQDGIVHVTAPYSVDNGGFYDVDNLTIHYAVTNYSKVRIAEQTFVLGSLPAGSIVPGSLDFTIDVLGLYRDGVTWMVFHDDILNFQIDVSCFYTMKLVKFDAAYTTNVDWGALIRSWDVERPSSLPMPGIPYAINYSLSTSDLLYSLPPATVNISLLKDGNLSGWGSTEVLLGGDRTGNITLTLSSDFVPTLGSVYQWRYEIRVLDYVISETWTYAGGTP